MELLIYGLCFGSIAVATAASYAPITERVRAYVDRRAAEASEQLSDMFMETSHRKVWIIYALSPVTIGGLFWLLTENAVVGLIGVALGILIPRAVIKQMRRARQKKFHAQLVDSLLLTSSSLKAGLSMLQAFGVIAEEMPPPISQEFGLLLKETRMGVSMEDAVAHLRARMPSDDMNLFATAVLVARETGGDITHIFGRLVETMRERKKLKEKILTLTFMARMQGIIMACLPFAFGYLVYQINREYFDFFLKDEFGRMLLVGIVFLQTIGFVLFARFSKAPI